MGHHFLVLCLSLHCCQSKSVLQQLKQKASDAHLWLDEKTEKAESWMNSHKSDFDSSDILNAIRFVKHSKDLYNAVDKLIDDAYKVSEEASALLKNVNVNKDLIQLAWVSFQGADALNEEIGSLQVAKCLVLGTAVGVPLDDGTVAVALDAAVDGTAVDKMVGDVIGDCSAFMRKSKGALAVSTLQSALKLKAEVANVGFLLMTVIKDGSKLVAKTKAKPKAHKTGAMIDNHFSIDHWVYFTMTVTVIALYLRVWNKK